MLGNTLTYYYPDPLTDAVSVKGIFHFQEELRVLYRIGTKAEMATLPSHLPKRVVSEILRGICVLDCEYGAPRDYLSVGGYSLLAETKEDAETALYDINGPCEWATRIGNTGYLSALYILTDDYSIMLYLPISAAIKSILDELEG